MPETTFLKALGGASLPQWVRSMGKGMMQLRAHPLPPLCCLKAIGRSMTTPSHGLFPHLTVAICQHGTRLDAVPLFYAAKVRVDPP